MSTQFEGYDTDPRLLRAIEKLAGVELTGCDHPEHSSNLADQLWCDGFIYGMSPSETQQILIDLLPAPVDEDGEIWWGESRFAESKGGKWLMIP